jgi:hypothetical protein
MLVAARLVSSSDTSKCRPSHFYQPVEVTEEKNEVSLKTTQLRLPLLFIDQSAGLKPNGMHTRQATRAQRAHRSCLFLERKSIDRTSNSIAFGSAQVRMQLTDSIQESSSCSHLWSIGLCQPSALRLSDVSKQVKVCRTKSYGHEVKSVKNVRYK